MPDNATKQRVQNSPLNRDVNAAQRAALAVKLRSQKVKYDDIANMCGYGSAGAAHKAVKRELERTVVDNVDELRKEELDSLERLEFECWKIFQDKDRKKGQLFAVDRILSIKDRRAKLMGLDRLREEAVGPQMIIREVPAGLLAQKIVEAGQ